MSAKSITSYANKPDPSISARLFNLYIDGEITYADPPSGFNSAVFISAASSPMGTAPVNINLATLVYDNIGITTTGGVNFTLPSDGNDYLVTLSMNDIIIPDQIGVISMTAPGNVSAISTSTKIGPIAGSSLPYGGTQLVQNRTGGSSFTFYGYTASPPTRNMALGTGYKTMLTITRI